MADVNAVFTGEAEHARDTHLTSSFMKIQFSTQLTSQHNNNKNSSRKKLFAHVITVQSFIQDFQFGGGENFQ